jgi:hypothetical protein
MERSGTKEAAEALLSELPSVLGAFVREDVFGHPREIHLLIAAGPKPRHFARDIRDLLEERLGVPVDQRIISIAQIAADAAPHTPPASSPADAVALPTTASPEPVAEPVAEPAGSRRAGATPVGQHGEPDPRLRFDGAETVRRAGRLTVSVRLRANGEVVLGEDTQVDAPHARLRSGARALLEAANTVCAGQGRFELEDVSVVRALGREYVLLTVIAHSARLGRKPLTLAGAHAIESGEESAAALAALKAVNRILALMLGEPPT